MYTQTTTSGSGYTVKNDLYGDDDLDVTTYKNGIYLATDGDLKNTFTSNGISIQNQDYIAYDLTSLSGAIGGLAGKTIEIEFDEIPKGNDNGL